VPFEHPLERLVGAAAAVGGLVAGDGVADALGADELPGRQQTDDQVDQPFRASSRHVLETNPPASLAGGGTRGTGGRARHAASLVARSVGFSPRPRSCGRLSPPGETGGRTAEKSRSRQGNSDQKLTRHCPTRAPPTVPKEPSKSGAGLFFRQVSEPPIWLPSISVA